MFCPGMYRPDGFCLVYFSNRLCPVYFVQYILSGVFCPGTFCSVYFVWCVLSGYSLSSIFWSGIFCPGIFRPGIFCPCIFRPGILCPVRVSIQRELSTTRVQILLFVLSAS